MKPLPAAVHRAVADLTAAKKMLADARRVLARLTRPGHPTYLVDPDWEWARELMEARRAKLLAIPGVVGVGLGFRLRGGLPTGEPCLTVYVQRKLAPGQLAAAGSRRIPKTVRSGKRRLPVDVIELGAIRRHVGAGDSLGPRGGSNRGTIGVLAEDLDAHDTVAVTAMHVTLLQQFPASGIAVPPQFVSPMPGGGPFAALREGTMTGIDAAKLVLDIQQPAVSDPPQVGRIKGWRPITFPGDQGTTVKMFGAVSGFQTGYIVNPIASIPAENLDAAILVNIFTQGGDSGAALVDHEGLLLGFLVGEGGQALQNLRVFTPASLVFATLRCDIPTT
ncbi:MAG TPA: hypothetical protein VL025_22640 [Thermoanaerobaculia bacterium]|nr:hypothetical protein [Thermoanaerobaculia bacterium]